MHTMLIVYNNSYYVILLMKTQNMNQENGFNSKASFYPRIIREFEEYDEPMVYGGN